MTPRVVLVGLPGAGKSTTGRRLAKILCVPFADSDDLVESANGMAVTEVFAREGEAAFRALEYSAVCEALQSFTGVLALGGGALTHADTRQAVVDSATLVVLLSAAMDTLVERVGDGGARPLLAGGTATRLQELAAQRDATYRAVASFTVETDGRTPGQVAAHIAARMHKLGATS